MFVIPHFVPMNSVQTSRCGCFIDIRCRKTVLSHDNFFAEIMPLLMCLFPGDWPQRNSEELCEWWRGIQSLAQCYTHPRRHPPPTPDHTRYVRVLLKNIHWKLINASVNLKADNKEINKSFQREILKFSAQTNFLTLHSHHHLPPTCHPCFSGWAVVRRSQLDHWPQGLWCVITAWPLAAPFPIPPPPPRCVSAPLVPTTSAHTHTPR